MKKFYYREGKKMEYPVGVMTNTKKETVYYIGKGVDIEKLFRSATLENPKYQFYKFPYSEDEDVMFIKKKNRKENKKMVIKTRKVKYEDLPYVIRKGYPRFIKSNDIYILFWKYKTA